MRAAIYVRVSTLDQEPENQLRELRTYVNARGWSAVEFVDHGISGSKDSRPALDRMMMLIRQHKIQVVVCWKLDRLGRNLRHLVLFLDDLRERGIAFVTLGEGIDTSTPAGRLVAGVLGSIAEFERARVQERVRLGLARVKASGKRLGRPRQALPVDRLRSVEGMPVRAAAKRLGVSRSTLQRWRSVSRKSSSPVA